MVCSDVGGSTSRVRRCRRSQNAIPAAWLVTEGSKKRNRMVFAGQHRVLRHPGHVWVSPFLFAATRIGADQNQPAYRFRVAQRERLRYVASDREAENINSRLVQRLYEASSVVCLRLEGIRSFAA